MFNRLKNFSEDVAKTFNDMNDVPKNNPINQLKQNSKILATSTPSESDLVQPTDEPVDSDQPTNPRDISTETDPSTTGDIPSEITTARSTPIPGKPVDSPTRGNTASPSSNANPDGIDLDQLSPILRSKMKKFYKYEEKYPILLDAFKVEKKKGELVKMFENVLKEHTPISSISDAGMLVDFIKGLNEKNQLVNDELKKQINVNSGLKRVRRDLEEENKKLKAEVESSKGADDSEKEPEELQKVKGLIEKLQTENDSLKTENDSLKTENDSLKAENSKLGEEKSNLESLITEKDLKLESESKNISLKVEGLQTELKETQIKLKEAQTEAEQTHSKLKEAQMELESTKTQLEQAESELQDKSNGPDVANTTEEVKESNGKGNKKKKTVPKAQFDKLTQELKTLTATHQTLKKQHEAKTEDVENLRDSLKDIGNDLTEARDKAKASQAEITKLQEEINELNSQIETLSKEKTDLTQEKAELQKNLEQAKNNKTETSLKLELSSVKSSIEHKDKTIETLTQKVKDLEVKESNLEKLTEQYKAINKEKNDLFNKQEYSFKETKALREEVTKLKSSNLKISNDFETLKAKYDSVNKSKNEIFNEFQIVKQQYEELMMKSRESGSRIDNLVDELTEHQKLLNDRTKETTSIKKILVDTQQQFKDQKHEFDEALARVNQEKVTLESEFNVSLKKKQREIDELKSITQNYLLKITDLEKNNHDLKTNRPPPVESNDELVSTLRNSLEESSAKLDEFKELNNVLKRLNDESNLKFEKLSKNYKLLTQQYRMLESKKPVVEVKEEATKGPNIDYLKNVLIGFFEHKDQRDRLLPVLKTLFELTKDEERKMLIALK
ncbi:golgin Imh1p [[Candida] jaroonii]|uniref:Golgin Imh1p n=1 Tax=[Candida] jaroonii TaxID=467808 RepID=A0ACA9YE80_9ASCO|nr:golgin Imh1p [[Candida] jaroonii]